MSIKYNDLTEFMHTCSKCKTTLVSSINLNYGTVFEVKCSVCSYANYHHNFEFSVSYLKKHIPDSPLIKEYCETIKNNGVHNCYPIIKFVKNYVELQKTLLGE